MPTVSSVPTAPGLPTVVVRSLPARLGTLGVGGVVGYAVAMVWVADGPLNGLRATAWGGIVLLAVWALWWAPQLRLRDGALTVRNAWRTHTVAWDAVEGCRTRWALEVHLRDGRVVKSAAAQRPGGMVISERRRAAMNSPNRPGRRTAREARHDEAQRAVRPEYLAPANAVFRTALDADSAGDLIEAYAQRHAELAAIGERRDPRGDGATPPHAAGGSRWNRVPLAVGGALALLLVAAHLASGW